MELVQDQVWKGEQADEYVARVDTARVVVNGMARGTRARLASELKLTPATISNVLNLRQRSVATLLKIEQWLQD